MQNKSHVSYLPWLRIAWEEMTDKRRNSYETQLESEKSKAARHTCTHVCDDLCHLHRDAGTMYSQQYCLPGWGSVKPGDFVKVKINEVCDYDLIGEICK